MKSSAALTLLLSLTMILSVAIPAIAQDNDDEDNLTIDDRIDQQIGYMGHSVSYMMEGRIDFKKQAGHFCNTGAEMKQTISGDGSVDKSSNIVMQEGYLQVADQNDWITAEDAVKNLIVTTSILLCTPPKYVYEDEDGNEIPVKYRTVRNAHAPLIFDRDGLPNTTNREMINNWEALTDQVWAVQVESNPGNYGQLRTDFDAAFGIGAPVGSNLRRIGDFFRISQTSSTDDGILKRYIDISNPRSHGYLHEDMQVTGESHVRESFRSSTSGRAFDTPSSWSDLF